MNNAVIYIVMMITNKNYRELTSQKIQTKF